MSDAISRRLPPEFMQLEGIRILIMLFDVVVEKDSAGYFVASVPALPGCHTQTKALDELMERMREAIELCLEIS